MPHLKCNENDVEIIKVTKNKCPVYWFTGLSGAGKSTLAELLTVHLKNENREKVVHLDGDQIRSQLGPYGLGYSKEDRQKHLCYMALMAATLQKAKVTVVASFITPYESMREILRRQCKPYFEIYVSTPLSVCEKRDVKGFYSKARKNEISSFTGIDAEFEIPTHFNLEINTENKSIEETFHELKKGLLLTKNENCYQIRKRSDSNHKGNRLLF